MMDNKERNVEMLRKEEQIVRRLNQERLTYVKNYTNKLGTNPFIDDSGVGTKINGNFVLLMAQDRLTIEEVAISLTKNAEIRYKESLAFKERCITKTDDEEEQEG